jgi:hydrogenase maturation protease
MGATPSLFSFMLFMQTPSKRKHILILGIGNMLLRDEGVGVHVAQRLQSIDLPEEVELMDGGVLGLDLLEHLEGREKIIIVDAVQGGKAPGTIYRLRRKNMGKENRPLLSLHDIDLSHVLEVADLMGQHLDPVIIGIEPKDLSVGLELSPEIEVKIPDIIKLVMEEIESIKN